MANVSAANMNGLFLLPKQQSGAPIPRQPRDQKCQIRSIAASQLKSLVGAMGVGSALKLPLKAGASRELS
jgi:hypothetical protein